MTSSHVSKALHVLNLLSVENIYASGSNVKKISIRVQTMTMSSDGMISDMCAFFIIIHCNQQSCYQHASRFTQTIQGGLDWLGTSGTCITCQVLVATQPGWLGATAGTLPHR